MPDSDLDKAIEASRPEFERMVEDNGLVVHNSDGDGYEELLTEPMWHGWCCRIRSEESTLNEMGYYRTDTTYCSLNMENKQWQALSDAVVEWGESPEETIAIACRGALRAENEEVPG
jgi:hypothetical protein